MALIPPECQSIQDEIERIQAAIRHLQDELGSAPPAERPIIIEMIRREREKEAEAKRRLSRCIANAGTYFDVVGVEYTQAIQYFDFNGQGSGHARDDSVPLVSRKPLIIRVHVARQEHGPPFPPNLSGTLRYGPMGGPDFPEVGPLATIPARAANDINRVAFSHTLDFRIPAALCTGTLRFSLTLFDPGTPGFESTHQLNPRTFRDIPMLRIHGVLVHYTGNGLNLPAPTGQDLIDSLELVRRIRDLLRTRNSRAHPLWRRGQSASANCDGDSVAGLLGLRIAEL